MQPTLAQVLAITDVDTGRVEHITYEGVARFFG